LSIRSLFTAGFGVLKVRFYFSFRSPFAGIAFYRLRRCALFNDFDIELIPVWPDIIFGGHMDNPSDNVFKLSYVFEDATRQAEEAGLATEYLRELSSSLKLPKGVDYRKQKVGLNLPPEPWGIAHHAFLYAQEQNLGWIFGDAVFARRFSFDGQGGGDVLNLDVLGDIAEQVGLDPEAVRSAHQSGRYRQREQEIIAMSESDGVFGVPFFAYDFLGEDDVSTTEVFWGNDHLPYLYKALTGADTIPLITADSLTEVQPPRR